LLLLVGIYGGEKIPPEPEGDKGVIV